MFNLLYTIQFIALFTMSLSKTKHRLYQTYKKYVSRQDYEIGDPMLIDEFILWVHNEYQSAAIDWAWTDMPVAKADITREWLEGLAVNSRIDLIAEYSEDCCLQVLVTELNVPFC
jgi:hypothetical protein